MHPSAQIFVTIVISTGQGQPCSILEWPASLSVQGNLSP